MTMEQSIIAFNNVSKVYEPGNEVALRNASFSVAPGEFVCIIGPSGGGKSTVLKIIAGLEKESSGLVTRPMGVSMVFQSGALLPWLTALDNVAFALQGAPLSEARRRAESVRYLELMGLKGFEAKYPRDLSGGQQQRVGIARALAVEPAVLLLDEPFSSLDPQITEELHKDVIRIWRETKKTIVMVSHLIEEAVALADRVLLVKDHAVEKEFVITLERPRRENEAAFAKEVLRVRREFFK
jgi:NitT/TauT family transport system ATP-binding protein